VLTPLAGGLRLDVAVEAERELFSEVSFPFCDALEAARVAAATMSEAEAEEVEVQSVESDAEAATSGFIDRAEELSAASTFESLVVHGGHLS
jgi:hypothetical protein